VPKELPLGTASISSQLAIPDDFVITDVRVDVNMDHEWVGDVTMKLEHLPSGATATLIDRPGAPTEQWGCPRDNIVATFSDAGNSTADDQCANTPPTINGTFLPMTSLAAFSNASSNGTWQLSIEDVYPRADGGTLNSWSLEICGSSNIAATATPTSTPTNTPTPTTEPVITYYFDDNFESNNGWTANPSGTDTATTGKWERGNPETTGYLDYTFQLDQTASGSNALVTGATAGSSVGTQDIDNGITTIRSPQITLPSNSSLTLSFDYYLAHWDNVTSADFLRVKVVGNTTQTIFEKLGTNQRLSAVWKTEIVSLDNFAGQNIYLLVEAADGDTPSLIEAAIDDIQITNTVINDAAIDQSLPRNNIMPEMNERLYLPLVNGGSRSISAPE